MLMGGRVAEELIFNEVTSGASNDIERATKLARNFICEYGMSLKLGTRKYGQSEQNVFLGKQFGDHTKDYAELTAREIDEEIKEIIDTAYKNAKKILTKHKATLQKAAKLLLEKETIEGETFIKLVKKSGA